MKKQLKPLAIASFGLLALMAATPQTAKAGDLFSFFDLLHHHHRPMVSMKDPAPAQHRMTAVKPGARRGYVVSNHAVPEPNDKGDGGCVKFHKLVLVGGKVAKVKCDGPECFKCSSDKSEGGSPCGG